jgi:hypothetical protein
MRHWINGQWEVASSDQVIETIDPALKAKIHRRMREGFSVLDW